MKIQRARVEALAEINQLIRRSKSVWGYPQSYLNLALPLLEVKPQDLERNLCFELITEVESAFSPELLGFFSVTESPSHGGRILEHLWIRPDRLGQGLGRAACRYLFRWAKKWNWPELIVLPEPSSEAFYSKMGFRPTDEVRPSRVPGGPDFRVFRIGNFTELDHV